MPKVTYNGVAMDEAWSRRIVESQKQSHYTAGGVAYPRIRYGSETAAPGGQSPCGNCFVIKGQFHVTSECEFEQCPKCSRSIGGHTCLFDEFGDDEEPKPSARPFALGRETKWVVFFVLLLGLLASLRALGVF
jgi:hypothetical protein